LNKGFYLIILPKPIKIIHKNPSPATLYKIGSFSLPMKKKFITYTNILHKQQKDILNPLINSCFPYNIKNYSLHICSIHYQDYIAWVLYFLLIRFKSNRALVFYLDLLFIFWNILISLYIYKINVLTGYVL